MASFDSFAMISRIFISSQSMVHSSNNGTSVNSNWRRLHEQRDPPGRFTKRLDAFIFDVDLLLRRIDTKELGRRAARHWNFCSRSLKRDSRHARIYEAKFGIYAFDPQFITEMNFSVSIQKENENEASIYRMSMDGKNLKRLIKNARNAESPAHLLKTFIVALSCWAMRNNSGLFP